MEDYDSKLCGCKGIRTCLLCERRNSLSKDIQKPKADLTYAYCPSCDMCWPFDGSADTCRHETHTRQLNGILVVPDFVSPEEEEEIVAQIDCIPWMPSQSGRRKQDFGPKVNFKKRRVKTGSFRGFPDFAARISGRLGEVEELSDFRPVELCHLEYAPERGSAIEPHLDDSWLWGERLVTLNLLSETVLVLTPVDTVNCGCHDAFRNFPPRLSEIRIHPPLITDANRNRDTNSAEEGTTLRNGGPSQPIAHGQTQVSKSGCRGDVLRNGVVNNSSPSSIRVEVRIGLPARSLLVLYSCARHHWYHEIKRDDVTCRRLAMTFRELSSDFLEDGPKWETGKELLSVAQTVIDL